jgi:hypothetical protein
MDLSQIIAPVVTSVVGIGAVSAFLTKYIPKIIKYAMIAKDAISILDDALEALEDGALTPNEIDKIKLDVAKLKDDLKK